MVFVLAFLAFPRRTRKSVYQEIVDEELNEPTKKKVSNKVRSLDGDFPILDDDDDDRDDAPTCKSGILAILVDFLWFRCHFCPFLQGLIIQPTQGKSTDKIKKSSSSGSDESDDGEAQSEILKQIKFPEVEREQAPASLVGAICRCVSKQVDKVAESINKLEKTENKSEVQSKYHGLIWPHETFWS